MAKLKRFSGTPVSEGVRIEVGKYTVFAVRNEDKDISVRIRREPRALLRTCMRIPLLRGITRMLRDIYRFFDGISESAELRPQKVMQGNAFERKFAKFLHVHPQSLCAFFSACLIPILAFLLLYAAPEGAEAFLFAQTALPRFWINFAVCIVRIVCLLMGIWAASNLKVCRRLSMYRSAINQVTNCYECRDEITVENALQYPRWSRRSEPAFLTGVAVCSMVLFAFLRIDNIFLAAAARVLIIFGVAAVFNEPYSALEAAKLNIFTRILRAPMDLVQHMTTIAPHPQIMEVAVSAFQAALGEGDEEVKEN